MGRRRDDGDVELATEQFVVGADELEGVEHDSDRTMIAMDRPELLLPEVSHGVRSKPGRSKPSRSKPGRSKPGRSKPGRSKPGRSKPGVRTARVEVDESSRSSPRSEGRGRASQPATVLPSRQLASHGDRETWLGSRGDELVFIERSRSEDFVSDVRAADALSHPNIAETLQRGRDGGLSFVARRVSDAVSLADILQSTGTVPVLHALEITARVVEALDHVTGASMSCDATPDRIFVGRDGGIRLAGGFRRGTGTLQSMANTLCAMLGDVSGMDPKVRGVLIDLSGPTDDIESIVLNVRRIHGDLTGVETLADWVCRSMPAARAESITRAQSPARTVALPSIHDEEPEAPRRKPPSGARRIRTPSDPALRPPLVAPSMRKQEDNTADLDTIVPGSSSSLNLENLDPPAARPEVVAPSRAGDSGGSSRRSRAAPEAPSRRSRSRDARGSVEAPSRRSRSDDSRGSVEAPSRRSRSDDSRGSVEASSRRARSGGSRGSVEAPSRRSRSEGSAAARGSVEAPSRRSRSDDSRGSIEAPSRRGRSRDSGGSRGAAEVPSRGRLRSDELSPSGASAPRSRDERPSRPQEASPRTSWDSGPRRAPAPPSARASGRRSPPPSLDGSSRMPEEAPEEPMEATAAGVPRPSGVEVRPGTSSSSSSGPRVTRRRGRRSFDAPVVEVVAEDAASQPNLQRSSWDANPQPGAQNSSWGKTSQPELQRSSWDSAPSAPPASNPGRNAWGEPVAASSAAPAPDPHYPPEEPAAFDQAPAHPPPHQEPPQNPDEPRDGFHGEVQDVLSSLWDD